LKPFVRKIGQEFSRAKKERNFLPANFMLAVPFVMRERAARASQGTRLRNAIRQSENPLIINFFSGQLKADQNIFVDLILAKEAEISAAFKSFATRGISARRSRFLEKFNKILTENDFYQSDFSRDQMQKWIEQAFE